MQTKVILDPERSEPEAVIYAPAMTDEVIQAEHLLRGDTLNGYDGEQVMRLSGREIIRIYTERQRVFAQTSQGVFQLRHRLYELETMLDSKCFLRISNAEIVRNDAIVRLDLSAGGTIGIELRGGIRTYVSRRYVRRIKEHLGL